MSPTLHAIVYVGASAIALTYAFLRILTKGERWQGAAVFALAFFIGLDAYVWLRENEPPAGYPLFFHGMDWLAAMCAFGAAVYLRELIDARSPDGKLTLGLWLFFTYALICVVYWGTLAVQSKSKVNKKVYEEIWKHFNRVEPEGPIYQAVSKSVSIRLSQSTAYRNVSNIVYSRMAEQQPGKVPDPTVVHSTILELPYGQTEHPTWREEIVMEQLWPTARLAMILYGLCAVGGIVLIAGRCFQQRPGKFFDFHSHHLWIGTTVGLYFASLSYLLFLFSCCVCLCFAVGAPAFVLTLMWFSSRLKDEKTGTMETRSAEPGQKLLITPSDHQRNRKCEPKNYPPR